MKKTSIYVLSLLLLLPFSFAIDANLVSYYAMGNPQDSLGRVNLTIYDNPENLSGTNCLNGICSRLHGSGSGASTPFDSYSTYSQSYGGYLNSTAPICIDFYFNGTIQTGGYWQLIFSGTGGTRGHTHLGIQTHGSTANSWQVFVSDGGGGSTSSSFSVNTSAGYHYYAFCRVDTRIIVYEDTTLKLNATITNRSPTAPFYLTFAGNEPAGGSNYGHSGSYLAMYDEVGVWNTLLSYNDIVQRAAKDTNSFYPFSTPSADPSISFAGATPADEAGIFYNVNFVINATTENFGGDVNISIYVYNESLSLISNNSALATSYEVTYTGLPIGIYYFEAVAANGTAENWTETRTLYLYNISQVTTTSADTSTGLYSINWTNATITPSAAPVTINSFQVALYNSTTYLKYVGSFTELNLTNFNLYLNGVKEGQYYYFKIAAIDSNAYNSTTNTTSFYLDYPDGYLSARGTFNFTNGFATSVFTNLNYSCVNNLNTTAQINATFNAALFKSGSVTNNTPYTNTTRLSDGTNTLTITCSDFNTQATNTTSVTAYVKSIYLIDEKDNTLFDVSNLTSVRVYYDSNSTYYDFKSAGTNTINISINDTDSLRFEFVRSSGEVVIVYVNLGLLDTQARICVNKDDVTQYEQGIVSSQIKGVVLKNVFSNCVVAADYTRFAYENSFILKAYTIHSLYYLYTYVDGVKTYLASVDGSIQNLIKLDVLEYSRAEVPANVIGDAVGIEVYTNSSAWITYLNYLNNSASAVITITRLDTGEVVFTSTETDSPNYFTILFDFSTLENVTSNTLFMLKIVKTDTNGNEFTIKRYFTSTGAAGNVPSSYAYMISIGIAIFGLTIVAVSVALSWFGMLALLVALIVLALAPFTTATMILGVTELVLLLFLFSLNLISNTQGRGGGFV